MPLFGDEIVTIISTFLAKFLKIRTYLSGNLFHGKGRCWVTKRGTVDR
ncbi:hypothetical protein NOC27_670 [Nitrosococcus oceani AFC27]|nr:hypothetical protein NOC27_670 [Nitrosococcus oceani AFC27]